MGDAPLQSYHVSYHASTFAALLDAGVRLPIVELSDAPPARSASEDGRGGATGPRPEQEDTSQRGSEPTASNTRRLPVNLTDLTVHPSFFRAGRGVGCRSAGP